MISITDDETGQLLQFPDGTDESVIRAAIDRVRAGTHHQHAVGPDFSDVEGGADSTARRVPQAQATFDLSRLQHEADRVAANPGTIDLSGVSVRRPSVASTPPNSGPQPPPMHRSEDYWRSVTGSDNPEDWSKYARNAQLAETERGGAGAMSDAGFLDRGMYYESPQTGERYLKHHKSGAMPAAPDPYEDLNAQVDASREFLRGIPARVAGSVAGAVSTPVRAIEGIGAGLHTEIEDLANAGHGGDASSGAGFRRGFVQDWATNPVGQGADAIQRNVVDPARERLLDASIRAGDSPLAAAGTETGQAALGEVGNPVNWVGPAELIEGLRGYKALSPVAQRAAELEARGGALAIEDGSGIVSREFGRGSAPSEIAQGKLARDMAVPREPLIYFDRTPDMQAVSVPHRGVLGPVKGRIPDAIGDFLDQPWRTYNDSVPLERPTSAVPRPRSVDRDPLPLPPVDVSSGVSDDGIRQVAGLWDYASRRYPSTAAQVKKVRISPYDAHFDYETGELAIPPDADLGLMMHEMTHAAQSARGKIPDSVGFEERAAAVEPYSVRAEEVYRRAAQPLAKNLTPEEIQAIRAPSQQRLSEVVSAGRVGRQPAESTFGPEPTSESAAQPGALVPLSKREYADAFNNDSIQPTGGIRSDGEARAYTAWLEKNGMNPDHVERFGESPELERQFFDLHNPDIGPEPPVSVYERARVDAMSAQHIEDQEIRRLLAARELDPIDPPPGYEPGPHELLTGREEDPDAIGPQDWNGIRYFGRDLQPGESPPSHVLDQWDEHVTRSESKGARLEEIARSLEKKTGRRPTEQEVRAAYQNELEAGPVPLAPVVRFPGKPEPPPYTIGDMIQEAGDLPIEQAARGPRLVGQDPAADWVANHTQGKQPPIVAYRQEAARIEQSLPPVPEGQVRLWRGNRPGEIGQNPSFTDSLPGIALPFRDSYGGGLSYVDVPEQVVRELRPTPGAAGGEFRLPAEIAAQAREVPALGGSTPGSGPGSGLGPRRLYAAGPPSTPVPSPLSEPEVARAMGWNVPPGSPRAISDPIRTADFQTNLAAQLGGGPESDAVAQYIVDRSDEVFRAIGPPQSWDTLEEMAARLGRTKESFLADSSHWSVLSPEARLRLTYVIKGNEQRIGELQAKLAQGAATDVDRAELLHAIETRGSLIQLGAKSGSAYGRALNSLKAEARLALGDAQMARQQLYRRYSKMLDAEKPMMDALSRLDPGNPDELQAFLRHVDKPTLRQYIQEFWVASILSSPASHERNLIGNSVNAIMENAIVRPTSALWDAARVSGPGAASSAKREVFFRETPAAVVGLGRGLRQGFRRGLEVLRRGYDPESMSGKLFPVRSAFARSQNRIVRDYVGPVVTMPLRLLSASDAVAKTMNWTAEVYAQAARTAAKEGLSGTGFASRVADLVSNPTDDMVSAADSFALKATFNDETSAVGKAIANLRDIPKTSSTNPALQAGIEGYRTGMGFMLPFIHIADRLMVRGMEYTPVSIATSIGARRAGNMAEAADLAARASIGSLVMTYAASLAMEGRITGAAPDNEAERAAFYGANKQPWSVRTEDGRWVPYGQLQPVGTPFALVAAAYKGWSEHEEAPDTEKLGHAAAQIGSYVTDQSYLSALSKMMDVVSGAESSAGRAFSDITANTIWGFAPYSGLVRTIARGVDPRVIDARSISDKITQNMPVVSLGLNGKLDPWGEEIVPTGGRLRTVLASGTVMLPSQEHTNPLDQELGRLGMPLGYVGNNVTDSKKKIKLSDDEHYLYQQMAGRASKLLLEELFAKDGYTDLDTEQQRDEATKAIGAARKFARIVVLRYHNGAENYPGLNPSLGVVNWVNSTGTGTGAGSGSGQ